MSRHIDFLDAVFVVSVVALIVVLVVAYAR